MEGFISYTFLILRTKNKKMNISWLDYIYANNRSKLFDLISSYNMPLPQSYEELYECVDILINKYGEEAEKQILEIHPDYKEIKKMVLDESKVEPFHNFTGEANIKSEISTQLQQINIDNELKTLKRNQNILLVVCGFLLYHTILNKK